MRSYSLRYASTQRFLRVPHLWFVRVGSYALTPPPLLVFIRRSIHDSPRTLLPHLFLVSAFRSRPRSRRGNGVPSPIRRGRKSKAGHVSKGSRTPGSNELRWLSTSKRISARFPWLPVL